MRQKISSFGVIATILISLSSCGIEQKRQVVLPQSDESVLPWNGLREGEAQGQFGAIQQR